MIMTNKIQITRIYEKLTERLAKLRFAEPIAFVYNPLEYAADGVAKYLDYSEGLKRAVFVGMNPGPWGMAQTGVPFGEVNAVRDFLGISEINITPPQNETSLYRVQGLECPRSEVSGKRLWGLFKDRFGTSENFFRDHFVVNYCPLLYLVRSGGSERLRNFTPDKLPKAEREKLFEICNVALNDVIKVLGAEYVIGVGNFAYERVREVVGCSASKAVKILHPSPASPQSNKNWAGKVTEQLIES
ncbi:MAG: hypothetical protein IJU31_00320, partial [Synergistaceae bacterium]|nr:hypothetical protein [Synergistaceae bacterium]